MKKIIVLAAVLCASFFNAQTTEKRPDNWFNLDPAQDKVNGVSTEKTYKELLKDKKSVPVIVGVLDSGVDFNHEDLKDVMWTNPGEIPGNGIDDDKNGYVDDIHGWNFLGNKDGRNVECENLESTRLLRKLKPKYDGKTEADLKTKEEKAEFKLYQEVKQEWTESKDKFEGGYNQIKFILEGLTKLNDKIKDQQKVDKV
ncbi:MAG: peptidase and in kexin sedolisin, partial [Bacteroidetes bacterium]|nr:peptidase and in kexin sedolisin [Bacteroidota bacterium]